MGSIQQAHTRLLAGKSTVSFEQNIRYALSVNVVLLNFVKCPCIVCDVIAPF